MDAPLALYRRHRPETFAEVIGQDHVTDPLRQALAANRVNHAYLFSGPRGCGKTTSARILARALNCERAPIADPCGECQSCLDLARGGPGSVDVIEIDAASHGGVADARDLRERAFFAPVNSRYKVYIIDEAHMVSTEGFNALLKLVEEPPPHLKFIFATTEPDKVIGTIRSRTHHYPFRLVPPKLLGEYLLSICEEDGVRLDPAALPLVVRAGGGSVRDTLSVLDQLLSGAGPDGVTYDLAVQLLGYTPDTLLDEVVFGFGERDGARVFSVIDKVMESGQDPRRFVEDLLQRWRDLVVLAAVPNAIETGLLDVPEDRADRMRSQRELFTPGELTRAADAVATALVDFRGATAPRMLLELLCARLLVPAADGSLAAMNERLERLEETLRNPAAGLPSAAAAPATAPPAAPAPAAAVESPAAQPQVPEAASVEPVEQPRDEPVAASEPDPIAEATDPEPETVAEPAPVTPAPTAAGVSFGRIQDTWAQILAALERERRLAWIIVSQNARPIGVDNGTLTIGLVNEGARNAFEQNKIGALLTQVINQILGVSINVNAIIDPTVANAAPPPAQPSTGPAQPAGPSAGAEQARAALKDSIANPVVADPDDGVSSSDPVVDDGSLSAEELLAQHLGAEVIDESEL